MIENLILNKFIIFVDETAYNTDLMPKKAYWVKGQKLELIKTDFKYTLTMIAAIGL